MEILIKSEFDGRLLLSFLKHEIGISGRLLSRLKRTENGISVNGERVTVRYVLRSGDMLSLADGDFTSNEAIEPRDLGVEVLYEDNDVIAVNKPPHMPTHPSHGHHDDTLANAMAYKYLGSPFVFRPVNRLDRDTSGVVLIAKNQRAASFFASAMASGEFKKKYIAVIDGELSEKGTVNAPIRRKEKSIIFRETCKETDDGAQSALTEYKTLFCANGHSLVELFPKTGRTHQLRVHLASLDAPICGDDLYGSESELIDRQALHAVTLEFPILSGERITVFAPVPEDIIALCRELKIELPNEERNDKQH